MHRKIWASRWKIETISFSSRKNVGHLEKPRSPLARAYHLLVTILKKKQLYVFSSRSACVVNSTHIHLLTHLNAPETRPLQGRGQRGVSAMRQPPPLVAAMNYSYVSLRFVAIIARQGRPRYTRRAVCFLAWWKFNGYWLVSRKTGSEKSRPRCK